MIHELRQPKTSKSLSDQLGYLCSYTPSIKLEYNLRLVVQSFYAAPLNNVCTVENTCLVVEAFQTIAHLKSRISNPTIPVDEFCRIIVAELGLCLESDPRNPIWKLIPPLVGMLSIRNHSAPNNVISKLFLNHTHGSWRNYSRSILKSYLSNYLCEPESPAFRHSATICLAEAYSANHVDISLVPSRMSPLIYHNVIEILFGENDYSLQDYALAMENPGKKHLIGLRASSLSLLAAECLRMMKTSGQSLPLVLSSLNHLKSFNRAINTWAKKSQCINTISPATKKNDAIWHHLKSILFSQVIILEASLMTILSGRVSQVHSSIDILDCLYNLHFIVLALGHSEFEALAFLTTLAIDTALQDRESFETYSNAYFNIDLAEYFQPNVSCKNLVTHSQLIFALKLWELYMLLQPRSDNFPKDVILPRCMQLAEEDKCGDQDVLEAAHSVLLLYFSNAREAMWDKKGQNAYASLVMRQFPSRLSNKQLDIALVTVGSVACRSSSSTDEPAEFLENLLIHAAHAPISAMLRHDAVQDGTPRTIREAIVSAVLKLLPYIRAASMASTLNKMWCLIQSSSDTERSFLIGALWRVISTDLDVIRADVAYEWWYNSRVLGLKLPQSAAQF